MKESVKLRFGFLLLSAVLCFAVGSSAVQLHAAQSHARRGCVHVSCFTGGQATCDNTPNACPNCDANKICNTIQ